jgi:Leucine-rich repeat (LRR) protein
MLLRELNCACNKIPEFPKQIGKLRTLELIKCNGNKLSSLPDEIGECVKLRQLILGENHLQSVPASISKLPYLEELHLPNNRLSSFPPAITVRQPKLQLIDLTNNPNLKNMIPVSLQGNSDFIRWMCAKW